VAENAGPCAGDDTGGVGITEQGFQCHEAGSAV